MEKGLSQGRRAKNNHPTSIPDRRVKNLRDGYINNRNHPGGRILGAAARRRPIGRARAYDNFPITPPRPARSRKPRDALKTTRFGKNSTAKRNPPDHLELANSNGPRACPCGPIYFIDQMVRDAQVSGILGHSRSDDAMRRKPSHPSGRPGPWTLVAKKRRAKWAGAGPPEIRRAGDERVGFAEFGF